MSGRAGQPFFRPAGNGVELFVRLTPKAARDAVEGVGETADGRRHLKARVRAVPEDGKANRALEKLVAGWLGVAARDVAVTGGATARLKTLAIAGDARALAARLAVLAEKGG
ncbi:DUF167 family protein [Chelativorans intermedius]|uniref:UPF0235 protein ACFFJ2_16540 n=1 Tax=Chelativorans intermedius TaxID=515947 RepID=A0ABV6DBH1_9HYPH|nr:DUF167 family protein [Chelativorans intermedius]MCT8999364.1 DUF167 family protein [Chelativorans intermedius]